MWRSLLSALRRRWCEVAPDMLILVQVDDANGETLQHVVDRLVGAGARNVQILGTTTKKGRPGYMCLVDLPSEREDDVAEILAIELGAWGYRILESRHRHFDITLKQRSVKVVCRGRTLFAEVRCKYVGNSGRLLAIKAEHGDLLGMQASLANDGVEVSLRVLRAACESVAWLTPDSQDLQIEI